MGIAQAGRRVQTAQRGMRTVVVIKEREKKRQKRVLSYAEYYKRYGTTTPQDGWQMVNPTGQKVIYVR